MKINRSTKAISYLLANHQGVEIFLSVPGVSAKEQKYFLEYNNEGRKKYYGNGSIKRTAIEFFNTLPEYYQDKKAYIESQLAELYKQDIDIIVHELHATPSVGAVTMKSTVRATIEAFYAYKTLQKMEGTIEKRALSNYGQYHNKLLRYFDLEPQRKYTLADLSAEFWLRYRIALLNNEGGINTKPLCNASVNQHYQYITQFYGWLIDYNELPVRNHIKKLKKLNEAKQAKRFKVLSDQLLNEFYSVLEHKEKLQYTSLYLAALLLYENNIRLSEQVLIKVGHIDLKRNRLSVVNKKNDTVRTVIISAKATELIEIIHSKTVRKGVVITDEMYLFGGYNRLKPGKPLSYEDLGTWMRRFRKAYPQFAGRTLYEQKHTSITNQFDAGIDHQSIRERANHSSITTTEIYLQTNKVVAPYELRLDDME
ncbi:phage integrase family protein [Pedobacter hiemivivus]|uniref:Phage integrase family protein n=1 Tax=Pedobacter hiemivivus TaxID=2530454 RepID=A0A4U1G284_9SPHI|nr:tyrosine-type recombinase/integrase [Pedobacter hiemivivus]TKC57681.1 phage integrase family protein [Pedobacter hiemivivus]